MEEKKSNSSIIFIILFIIALIIIIVMSYFIWQISTENTDLKNQVNQLSTNTNSFTTNSSTNNFSTNNSTNLNTSNTSNSELPINYGTYTLANDEIDLEQENYDIVSSIGLGSTGGFRIDFNRGFDYYINGTYEISDNKIICTSELRTYVIGDAFGPTPDNYIFEFEILDSENLKLTKVPEDLFNLTVGEIYSFDNQNKLGVLIYDT